MDPTSSDTISENALASRFKDGIARARQAGEGAQEKLASAASDARLLAAEKLQRAARQLEYTASKEHGADGLRGKAVDGAHRLAGGLDTTAGYLRNGTADDLKVIAEQEIRANLKRSLVATFAVGFIIGRILR